MGMRGQGRGGNGRAVAAVVVTVVAAAGGAVAFAAARRARSGSGAAEQGAEAESWTCTCGTAFRVVGSGRHQVLWLADAPEDEPVLGDRCPSCDAPLPGADGSPAATER
jgi:hypothetical protein